MAQLHGLDVGFVLALGTQTTFDALDVRRFTRLEKLQLRHFNPGRAQELGWSLGLPSSLRILHMDGLEAVCFMVNPDSMTYRTLPLVRTSADVRRREAARQLLLVLPPHAKPLPYVPYEFCC